MINQSKAALFVSAILATTPLFAQTETTQTAQPVKQSPAYGDNPNIFKVLGHKAKEKIDTTAVKIDNGVQKGVSKVKPKAEQAWENTKDFTEETADKAANGINRTVTKAKEGVFGNPEEKAPIVQHSLSQSSTDNQPKTFLESVPAPQAQVAEPATTAPQAQVAEPATTAPQTEVQAPTNSNTGTNTADTDSSIPR